MSLVAEVLQPTGKLAKENIVLKADDLKRKLEAIKLEVQESLKLRYVEFFPGYVKLDKLLVRLDQVTTNYELLHNQIEHEIKPQVGNSVAEFHDILEDLKKVKFLKSVVWDIVSLHQYLEAAKDSKSQLMYLDAAHRLVDFEQVFNRIKGINANNYEDTIAILCALKTEFYVTKEDIIYYIENIWRQNIVISNNVEGKNKKNISLYISKDLSAHEEILKAFHLLNNLRPLLREFGNQFLHLVCEVLISNSVQVSIDEASSVLMIIILNEQSPQPSEVFKSMKTVFQFIYEGLFKLPIVDNDISELTAMTELGAVISEEFSTLIIEKCLKIAIPKQSKQLQAFYDEITAASNFCNDLQAIGFCPVENNNLLSFIQNVDVLPVDKMAQDILSRARSLMKKCLHQTIIVGVESSPAIEVGNSNDLNEMARTKSGLSKSTFLFPRCQISVSTKELVQLLQEVREEAKNIGPIHGLRLYYVARSICELYCCTVPTFHKDAIQNIPQQTAIFHNNCMYLAHQLCTLGTYYRSDLQANVPTTFIDLVPEIRRLGAEAFLTQMRHQRQQLLQIIQDQKAYQTVMVDEGIINRAEKSIRQCLCQLQLLQKVWSDILPSEVYFKAMGTLFNTCLEEIILRVLAMEDISADAAAQMDSVFSILLKQGPELFKITSIDKRNFVHLYVKRWFKFQELQLILSASMKEIVDRWSSSKGPLAAHFSSDDVKHLIRALFQNTERRATALAKIR